MRKFPGNFLTKEGISSLSGTTMESLQRGQHAACCCFIFFASNQVTRHSSQKVWRQGINAFGVSNTSKQMEHLIISSLLPLSSSPCPSIFFFFSWWWLCCLFLPVAVCAVFFFTEMFLGYFLQTTTCARKLINCVHQPFDFFWSCHLRKGGQHKKIMLWKRSWVCLLCNFLYNHGLADFPSLH